MIPEPEGLNKYTMCIMGPINNTIEGIIGLIPYGKPLTTEEYSESTPFKVTHFKRFARNLIIQPNTCIVYHYQNQEYFGTLEFFYLYIILFDTSQLNAFLILI